MSQVPLSQRATNLPLSGVKVYMQIRPMPVQRTPGGCPLTVIVPERCNEMLLDRELREKGDDIGVTSSSSSKRAALQGSDRIVALDDGSMIVHGDRVKHNAKKDIYKLGAHLVLSENSAKVIVFYNGSSSLLENIIAADIIPVVSPAWLLACRYANTAVPTADYELSIANSPRVPPHPKAHFDLPKHNKALKADSTTTSTTSMQPPSSIDEEDESEDDNAEKDINGDYKLALKYALQESESQLLYGNNTDGDNNGSTDELDDYDSEDSDDENRYRKRASKKKSRSDLTIITGSFSKLNKTSNSENVLQGTKTKNKTKKKDSLLLLPDSPLNKKRLGGKKSSTSITVKKESTSKSITFHSKSIVNTSSSARESGASSSCLSSAPLLAAPFLNPEEDSQPQVVAKISHQASLSGDAKGINSTSPSNNDLVNRILLATKQRRSMGAPAHTTTSAAHQFQTLNLSSVPTTQKLDMSEPYLVHSSSSSTLQPTPTPVSSQHLRTDILFSKAILEAQQRQMENTARLEREEAEEKLALSAGKRGGGKRSVLTPTLRGGASEYSDIKSEGSAYSGDTEGIAPKRLFSTDDGTTLGSKRPRSESPSSRKKVSDTASPPKPAGPIPVTFVCPAPSLCSISGLGDTRATVQSIMDYMGCGITSKVFGKRTVVKPTHMILVSGAVEDDADGPGSPSVIQNSNNSNNQGAEDASPGNSNSLGIFGNATTQRAYLQIASVLPKTYTRYLSTKVPPSLPVQQLNPIRTVTQGDPNDFVYPQPWHQLLSTFNDDSHHHNYTSSSLQNIVQFLASLSSSSTRSLPVVVRKVPSFMDNLVSSRVLLALATGIPLLSHKWVFACMEIAPQAQPYTTPTTTQTATKKEGKRGKVAVGGTKEVDLPKYALRGYDVDNVESHGKLYDGTIFCDDWSCSCCSDATDSDDNDIAVVESDDDEERKSAAIAARNLSRRPLRRDSVRKGTFLSYYGYPPVPVATVTTPSSKKKPTPPTNKVSAFSVKAIGVMFNAFSDVLSSSSSVMRRDIFTKYALVGLLPAEHSTYVSPFQIPVTDIVTLLCDHNNDVRQELATTYFGVHSTPFSDKSSQDATVFVSSGLKISELWEAMCLSLPSWNMKHQLETLPAHAASTNFRQSEEDLQRASTILLRGYSLLTNHAFLSESAYSSVRCTYLKSIFRGMTFLLLGQYSAPKNSDLIELIEIMGGSTTKDALAAHITAVIEMDKENGLNELVVTFRKYHEKRSSGGGTGGVSKKSPVNASPPHLVPASEEERQVAFQNTFPHVRLCLSLHWVFDCILHQRLMGFGKDNTGYVKVYVPPPTPSSHLPLDDSEVDNEDDNEEDLPIRSRADGDGAGGEVPSTSLTTPLNSTTPVGDFSSSRQGGGMAENDVSESDASPTRSSAGGGGRLSSGSRKKRMGPQSAVKDPDLQLSTQQLLLPSQASLHAMVPAFEEDE